MKIVVISDTHNRHQELTVPDGDVIVHCGDATMGGTIGEFVGFGKWFRQLPHKHKVFIPGNHDFLFDDDWVTGANLLGGMIHCLLDQPLTIEGIKMWGSPWTPRFGDWAFMLSRGDALMAKWREIPVDLDLLITHGPPLGILDTTARGEPVGDWDLREEIRIKRPKSHVFGHIHEGYGRYDNKFATNTVHYNCSNMDEYYNVIHEPTVIEMGVGGDKGNG